MCGWYQNRPLWRRGLVSLMVVIKASAWCFFFVVFGLERPLLCPSRLSESEWLNLLRGSLLWVVRVNAKSPASLCWCFEWWHGECADLRNCGTGELILWSPIMVAFWCILVKSFQGVVEMWRAPCHCLKRSGTPPLVSTPRSRVLDCWRSCWTEERSWKPTFFLWIRLDNPTSQWIC